MWCNSNDYSVVVDLWIDQIRSVFLLVFTHLHRTLVMMFMGISQKAQLSHYICVSKPSVHRPPACFSITWFPVCLQRRRWKLCAVIQPGGLHHCPRRRRSHGAPRLRLLLPHQRRQVGNTFQEFHDVGQVDFFFSLQSSILTLKLALLLFSWLQDCRLHHGVEIVPSHRRRVAVQQLLQLPAWDAPPGHHIPAVGRRNSKTWVEHVGLLNCRTQTQWRANQSEADCQP